MRSRNKLGGRVDKNFASETHTLLHFDFDRQPRKTLRARR